MPTDRAKLVSFVGEVVRRQYDRVTIERQTTSRTEERIAIEPTTKKDRFRCAVFVANRERNLPEESVLKLQDFFTAFAGGKNLEIVAREDVINAVAKLAKGGPNAGDPKAADANLDAILSNNTSALRLAQSMNADYVLVLTISDFSQVKQKFNGEGFNGVAVTTKLETTYRLLDGTNGGSQLAGWGTGTISDRVINGEGEIARDNVVGDLLKAAARGMADMLTEQVEQSPLRTNPSKNDTVEFRLNVSVADMVFPEVVKNDKGEYIVMAGRYKLEAMAAMVHLDGLGIGTTATGPNGPIPLKARPGIHRLKLSRAKFKDVVLDVNLVDNNQVFDVVMEMTPEGLEQFAAMTRFVQELKEKQIMTDAQARLWEAYAKQLEQNSLRINIDKQIRQGGRDNDRNPVMPEDRRAPLINPVQPGQPGRPAAPGDGAPERDPTKPEDYRRQILNDRPQN